MSMMSSLGITSGLPAFTATFATKSDAFAFQSTFVRRTMFKENFDDMIAWKTLRTYTGIPWSAYVSENHAGEVGFEEATTPVHYYEQGTGAPGLEENVPMDTEDHNSFTPEIHTPQSMPGGGFTYETPHSYPDGTEVVDLDIQCEWMGDAAHFFAWRDNIVVNGIEDEPVYEETHDMMNVDEGPLGYGHSVVSAINNWFGELTRIPFGMYMDVVHADHSNEISPQPSYADSCLALHPHVDRYK